MREMEEIAALLLLIYVIGLSIRAWVWIRGEIIARERQLNTENEKLVAELRRAREET